VARTSSAFQEIFAQRAQGFQVEFRFRNAPPRPPVGPCFVGNSLDAVLAEQSRQYKPLNAVEVNHTWRLHSEPDIGVPLAPSAMDLKSYVRPDENAVVKLHPDDEALLNWTGSMGDTAAEDLKHRQEQARTAARLSASGRLLPATAKAVPIVQATKAKKKADSRVLKEDMQTWMKKTTYLSNDYSRKVHDFKSLAQTKSELATDLQGKQEEMSIRRSVKAITESFQITRPLENPTNKQLKAVRVMQVLPDASNWGRAFTHVVIDKAPTNLPIGHSVEELQQAFVTNVEKRQANARMTCSIIVPAKESDDDIDLYRPVQSYDLDVVPLKEEDSPHMNFCIWVDKAKGIASYIPVASRVQLSTGRPSKSVTTHPVERRPVTDKEQADMEERMAEIDQDMAEKHHITKERSFLPSKQPAVTDRKEKDEDDDGEDDFGDDDDENSEEEEVFGGGTKTIVAET
jgi:Paf1